MVLGDEDRGVVGKRRRRVGVGGIWNKEGVRGSGGVVVGGKVLYEVEGTQGWGWGWSWSLGMGLGLRSI